MPKPEEDSGFAVVIRRVHPGGKHEAILAITDQAVVRAAVDAITKTLNLPIAEPSGLPVARRRKEAERVRA